MRTWLYEVNPFLNASDHSFRNAIRLSTYHDSALSSVKDDPFFSQLYSSFHPLHLSLSSAYIGWKTQFGKQQGETLNRNQFIQTLAYTKIQAWDIKIQNLYPRNTPEYKRLLPRNRIPFQTGSQMKRVRSVHALILSIGDDEALAALKKEIDAFYVQLEEAYDNQKQNLIATKSEKITVEEARVAMCIGQYANLGLLIHKFATEPGRLEAYFDMQAIRNPHQVFFTGKLKGGKMRTLVKHTFGDDDQIYLNNKGAGPLEFYLSHFKDRRPEGQSFTLAPGEQTIPAKNLGKLTDLYVMVYNPDKNLAIEFEMELL